MGDLFVGEVWTTDRSSGGRLESDRSKSDPLRALQGLDLKQADTLLLYHVCLADTLSCYHREAGTGRSCASSFAQNSCDRIGLGPGDGRVWRQE